MKLKVPLFFVPVVAIFGATQLPSSSLAADAKKVEIFSWWTSGGEAAALNALLDVFKKDNPDVQVINAAVAGGAGSAAKPILQTRLAGGNPPDSWQSHVGSELLEGYVAANYTASLSDLYQSEGWDKVVPKGLIDQVTKDGQIYAVPAGVHRGNVLWYSKKVLDKAGIKVGDKLTSEEFLAALAKLKAAGVTPLAVGDTQIWATTELFENTLMSMVGPEGWADLLSGKLSWDSPKVKEAAQLYAKELDFQNSAHASLTWDQAVKLLIEGKAAFTTMGDWAYGEFIKAGQKPNEDFGWVAYPGTDGAFISIVDSFTLAKVAPDKDAAVAWLKAVGGKAGQEAFNPLKGSIPSRTDVDKSKFGAYHQWSMASFAKDPVVPSYPHGEAGTPAFQQTLNDTITSFVVDRNVDNLTRALVTASKEGAAK